MNVRMWERKEWSTRGAYTAENPDDVIKRAGTSKVKPKCTSDFCNTCIHGMDYTYLCPFYSSVQKTKKIAEGFFHLLQCAVFQQR
jgi:hypothetical protein